MKRFRWRSRLITVALALASWLLVTVTAHSTIPSDGEKTSRSQTIASHSVSQTKQQDAAGSVLFEVEGVLETGDQVFEDGSLYDTYPFEAEAGQTITIRLMSEAFDTYLIVIDAVGQAIGDNDDSTLLDTNSTLTLSLSEAGTYRIVVNAFDKNGQGNYQLVVAAASDSDIQQEEANRLFDQGFQQYETSEFQAALQSLQQALEIYQAIGAHEGEFETLFYIAGTYFALGQSQQAIESSQQSLAIAREIGYSEGEISNISLLSLIYESLGQYQKAFEVYQQALEVARETGNRQGESLALSNLGSAYESLGQYQQSLESYQQALAIADEIDDRQSEGNILSNLGWIYNYLEESQQAIDFSQQALAIAREIGDQRLEAKAMGNLGDAYLTLGQSQEAIDFYQQRLAVIREVGDRQAETNVLRSLGIAYESLGDYQQAIDFHQQSLDIDRAINNRLGEAVALDHLGNVSESLGQSQQAIDFFQQSLAVDREIGSLQGEAISLNNIGIALINTNQPAEAEIALMQSVETFESLRTDLPDAQLISLADTQAFAYANLERALIAQGKATAALEITERARARAFVLQLASRLPNDPTRSAADRPETVNPPSIEEIQQVARDQNVTLVTYSVILDQALYIWVVHPSGELEFRSFEFNDSDDDGLVLNPIATIDGPVYRGHAAPSKLDNLVADSRGGLAVVHNNSIEHLQDLYEVLIAPIEALLPANPEDNVVFVPQGRLFLVPFPALQTPDGSRLIEKHTVLTAPSIQVLDLASKLPRQGSGFLTANDALVVGNPVMPEVFISGNDGLHPIQLTSLPGAEAEALAIGDFLNIAPLVGDQATEAQIKQKLPTASLIHLATHGLLEYGNPQSSGVVDVPGAVALTPTNDEDGLLTAAEILAMDLPAELAVLSACDTGRGRITGDGVVGLSRALITAGVPSVIVSLWAVPDAPTATLMTEFYRQLQQGQSKAQALRQAMLTTLANSPDPVNWAAFTLIGALA